MNPFHCSVIELRQYQMQPGRRDELVTLFEREFIETQEAQGLHVLGIFRDAEREDRFVWLRGYADMPARGRGLHAFYDGPVWLKHRDAANATMVDASNVLLLRPLSAWPDAFMAVKPADASSPWTVTVFRLPAPPDDALREALCSSGLAWLETEPAENNFPRHALRAGEQVVVALLRGAAALPPLLLERLPAPLQTLHLLPTTRSPLR